MQTIITGAIVIACTIGMVLFLFYINKKSIQKRNKAVFKTFSEKGAGMGVSFSSQEMLKDTIIGLDRLHQRLLIFDHLKTQSVTSLLLSEVKECVLTKEYQHINFGSEKQSDLEKTLRAIVLKFSFKNKPDHFELSFYDNMHYSIYEMTGMEQKARRWESLLCKLMAGESKVMA